MTTLSNTNYHVYDAKGPKQAAYSKIVIHEEPYTPNAKFEIKHSGNDHGVVYGSASSTLDSNSTAVDNSMIKAKREVITDPKSGEKKIKLTFASKAGVDLSNLTINGKKIDLDKVENQTPHKKPSEPTKQKKDEFTPNAQPGVSITDPKPEEKSLYSKIITINTGENSNANFEISHSGKQGSSPYSNWKYNLAANVSSSDDSAMKIKKETYIDPATNKESTRLVIAVKNGVDLSDLKVNNKNIDLGASKVSPGNAPQSNPKPVKETERSSSATVPHVQKPIPKPQGYSAVALADDEKNLYSKKFVFPLPFKGKENFDISQDFINGGDIEPVTWKYDSKITNAFGFLGNSLAYCTESKYNRDTQKEEKQLVLEIYKNNEPLALKVNGVAIDLNAEPVQQSASEDHYSHQTKITKDGFEISRHGLELENSGNVQYPSKHSVFTNTSQNELSISNLVTPEQYDAALENRNEKHGYKGLLLGSPSLSTLADNMARAGENDTLYSILKKTSLNTEVESAIPFHRINAEALSQDQLKKDFEVLVITGRGYQNTHYGQVVTRADDERRFLFDTKMLEHAIKNSKFNDECKKFQHLRNPSLAQLDATIKQRAQSAKANNRRLMVVYSGHGNVTDMNASQYGIKPQDFRKEGSKRFKFSTDNGFTEDDYKNILNKYLSDVETIHVINACHSGAALTMKASETSSELLYA